MSSFGGGAAVVTWTAMARISSTATAASSAAARPATIPFASVHVGALGRTVVGREKLAAGIVAGCESLTAGTILTMLGTSCVTVAVMELGEAFSSESGDFFVAGSMRMESLPLGAMRSRGQLPL